MSEEEKKEQVEMFLLDLKPLMLKHGIKSIEPADHDGVTVGIVVDEDHGNNWTEFAWSEQSIRPENLMSYSQNSEEIHILRILNEIGSGSNEFVQGPPGRFLDIGAYNPKLFSNTRALYERGWSGVMVEASPGPFLDLLAEYGNDERVELVCAAVSTAAGCLTKFHHSEAGVGTSSEAHYQKWRERAKFEGTFWASTVTPYELIHHFGKDFDFINIDVEGQSAELFSEALRDCHLKPKCWCVEHDGRQEELTRLAILQGYSQYHINGENVIYSRIQS